MLRPWISNSRVYLSAPRVLEVPSTCSYEATCTILQCEVNSRCQPVMNWLNEPNEIKTSGYLFWMSIYNIVWQQKVLLCKGRSHSFQTLLIPFQIFSNLNKEPVLSERVTHQSQSSKLSLVVALPYIHPNQTKQPYAYPSQAEQLCTIPLGTPTGTIYFYLVATLEQFTFIIWLQPEC